MEIIKIVLILSNFYNESILNYLLFRVRKEILICKQCDRQVEYSFGF